MLPGCGPEEPETPPPPPSGAISSATPEATEAGIRVLALGGNAVDAAVAVSLALGVSEPSESGLGGSVVMLIARRDGEPVVVHARPENVTSRGMTLLRPSALPVLVHAWRRYGSGRVEWEQLVAPARELAERGYPLGHFRQRMMVREYRRLKNDPVAAALFLHPDLSLPGEGLEVTMPELAATLERLEETAPDALPGGAFAELVESDLAELVEPEAARTLATPVEVLEAAPLRGDYRGWTVLAPGEPYAGARVLRALDFLESAPLDVLQSPGEQRTAWVAEALGYAGTAAATAPSAYLAGAPPLPASLADSIRVRPPLRRAAGATTPAPAATTPDATTPDATTPATPLPTELPPLAPSADTTGTRDETSHFSVVDSEGTAVSVTQSLGGPFGARASRLGFFLGRPAPVPAPAPTIDSLTGLARPTSPTDPWDEPAGWALPTVLTREGVVGLVLGSPGGSRALSAIVQTITEWVDGGLPIAEAVATPRLHVESDAPRRPRLVLEGVVWSDSLTTTAALLAPWGTRVRELAQARAFGLGEWDTGIQYLGMSAFYGGVNAVARENGDWAAAADPRRDGVGRLLTDEDVLQAQQGFEVEEPEEEPRVPPPSPPRRD